MLFFGKNDSQGSYEGLCFRSGINTRNRIFFFPVRALVNQYDASDVVQKLFSDNCPGSRFHCMSALRSSKQIWLPVCQDLFFFGFNINFHDYLSTDSVYDRFSFRLFETFGKLRFESDWNANFLCVFNAMINYRCFRVAFCFLVSTCVAFCALKAQYLKLPVNTSWCFFPPLALPLLGYLFL